MGIRTHIVLPEELLKQIDGIAGKRKRSEFIEEAIRTKLRLEKQRRALQSLKDAPPVEWYFPGLEEYDDISDFIHDQRRKDTEHRMKKLGGWPEDDALSS